MRSTLLLSLGLTLASIAGCNDWPLPLPSPDGETGGIGASGGASGAGGGSVVDPVACAAKSYSVLYTKPGCGPDRPDPVCIPDYACASFACSCEGKLMLDCDGFKEPYAYRLSSANWQDLAVGAPCDPTSPPSAP